MNSIDSEITLFIIINITTHGSQIFFFIHRLTGPKTQVSCGMVALAGHLVFYHLNFDLVTAPPQAGGGGQFFGPPPSPG